jgi:hypothetical protein
MLITASTLTGSWTSAATGTRGSLTGMVMNLDDTSRCPVGPECEGCGRLDELAVSTADTSVGLLCVTLCDACEAVEVLPVFGAAEATIRVLEHGEHVGVDIDAGSPP